MNTSCSPTAFALLASYYAAQTEAKNRRESSLLINHNIRQIHSARLQMPFCKRENGGTQYKGKNIRRGNNPRSDGLDYTLAPWRLQSARFRGRAKGAVAVPKGNKSDSFFRLRNQNSTY
jgi:hypothetical protein